MTQPLCYFCCNSKEMTNQQIKSISLILLAIFVLGACIDKKNENPKITGLPQFSLLSPTETNINFINKIKENIFTHENVLTFEYYYNGGGVGIADFNNDGLSDIVFAGNCVANKIYLNKGNLKFEDVTESSGINIANYWTNGVCLADVNNDGYTDIYFSNGGAKISPAERQNQLFINNGDLTFTEKAVELGINDGNFSTQSSFFDYDKDGDLDLFVINHTNYQRKKMKFMVDIMKDDKKVEAATSHLYRNDGDKFTNVTKEAGVFQLGYGLGLVTTDLNSDGLTDIYVANDYSIPDFMYINNGNGTFTDMQKEKTRQIAWFGMGCDVGDINNDGLEEIAVVDMATSDHIRGKTLMASMNPQAFKTYVELFKYQYQYMFNTFQLNNGNGTYSNIANMLGVAKTDWSWAPLLADFDNDSRKDYFVTNGYRRYTRDNDFRLKMMKVRTENGGAVPDNLKQSLWIQIPEVKLPNHIYHNDGDLHFTNMSSGWGMEQSTYSNGAAYGDLDNDGDLDLVVNNIDEVAFVYRNNSRENNGGNFLRVKLEGTNAETFNSKVTLFMADEIQYQEFSPVRGFESSVEPILHFGLGNKTEISKIRIEWPDGKIQEHIHTGINELITINRNESEYIQIQTTQELPKLFTEEFVKKIGIDYSHKENKFDDYAKEVLLPHSQSKLGPFVEVADITGDGLDDFYVGGAKGQAGKMYIQQTNGTFSFKNGSWMKDYQAEDMDALFFDADGDGDLDLYVVSGGGGDFKEEDVLLQDRLYMNYGNGDFVKSNALPKMLTSGMKVTANDFDGDGDVDLLVGGRTSPGKYPSIPKTYLLENQGKKFVDVTSEKAPDLTEIGMVTDLVWTDFSGDGKEDLILVGEWMAPQFFENQAGSLINVTSSMKGLENMNGWWYSIAAADIDNDGDQDYIIGNVGLNTKFTPKNGKILNIYGNDFDNSGTLDIVISKDYKGTEVPLRGRQCSSEQMPSIKEKFPTYGSFATASLEDIYSTQMLTESVHLTANTFESVVLINDNGTFISKPLPRLAQIAPINRILVDDVNQDGNPDLIISGNMYQTEVETPRYDAGTGLILIGNGKGDFEPMLNLHSGFFTNNDAKDMEFITINERHGIIVTNNNGELQLFLK